MNSAAIARFHHVGRLFTVAGMAAQRLGTFLETPNPLKVEECFTDLANFFVEASTVCEALAELTDKQHALGEGHGYGNTDSAALASFQLLFEGFGVPAVCLSTMDFTMDGNAKSACWSHAAQSLRMSAEASRRQIDLLGGLLPANEA